LNWVLRKLMVAKLVKEIPSPLYISTIHHSFHAMMLDLFLSQINPIHTVTPYLFKICSAPSWPTWSLSFSFFHPPHPRLFYHYSNFGEGYTNNETPHCAFFSIHQLTSSLFHHSPVLKHLKICASVSMIGQVSHPYKTTGKVRVYVHFIWPT
jgi:hypothetical protein